MLTPITRNLTQWPKTDWLCFRLSMLMAVTVRALTRTIFVLNMPENAAMQDFLGILGKDLTFSGLS
ncbi:MAG: hypothetical protein VR74_09180 [Hyphomonas sp. BRH_c22]|nr:MAG: hypothetical protein VR74_09180 [Hyphomonas sp. BRH_c22]